MEVIELISQTETQLDSLDSSSQEQLNTRAAHQKADTQLIGQHAEDEKRLAQRQHHGINSATTNIVWGLLGWDSMGTLPWK